MTLLAVAVACALSSPAAASETEFRFSRGIIPCDRGEIIALGDPVDSGRGPLKANGWAEYDFEVPAAGWYGLYFQDMPEMAREVFVDGRRVSLSFGESAKSAAELADVPLDRMTQEGWSKEANLPLGKGRHTLRLQRVGRMGFPAGLPRAFEIRSAGGHPAELLTAEFVGFREKRVGEPVRLAVTGGAGPGPTAYEIFRTDLVTGRADCVATVRFPAGGRFLTKTLEIPTPKEGVFQLAARAAGRQLTPREFGDGTYFVVDTRAHPPLGKKLGRTLVHEIDCLRNTIDGRPVRPGTDYWEANGPTRLNRSAAGEYRESNDGRGPAVQAHPKFPSENFSGFAYLFGVPEPGRPYLIEIDHPDDDWRSVCVSIVDVYDRERKKGYLPPTFAYETGGNLPLSGMMLTERVLFWPNGRQIHLGLASSRLGKRAAAARIRIFRVDGRLPARASGCEGRFVGLYMEEHERWHTHFNTPKDAPPAVADFLGLQRTVEWIASTGMNAFWPTAVAYQGATYDARELEGYFLKFYNLPRLSALLCEKYRLGYVAEILFARQRYFNERTMAVGAERPEELYTATWWGLSRHAAPDAAEAVPSWNILHPHVQAKVIAVYGELADALGDTKAFAGMAGRLDPWQWDGLYALTSLNWGYEDWTVAQFEKDTGVRVPGGLGDPRRFEARYRFLTRPEMKSRWVAWRSARVMDFLRRLAARIREAKRDAVFFLCGSGQTDEAHQPGIPAAIGPRLAEMGIDLAALAEEPGLAFLPMATYGRGKTYTYLADQKAYDALLDPAYLAAGKGILRGFAPFGAYQEWGKEFPLEQLGMPLERWHYCSGSDAAGVNALERLAVALAEQDTMAIRDGGYPLLHGEREFYTRWMAEYTRLPRRPFESLPEARDPVAVWQRRDDKALLFYAVNREPYPATVTLEMESRFAGPVVRLGTGETVPLARGRTLELSLDPFGLQVFRAPRGAAIASARTSVPAERIEFVRNRLSDAQRLAQEFQAGAFADTLGDAEWAAFQERLDKAWAAYGEGAYWRARTLLESAPVMAVYEKAGRYPEGQVLTRFPDLLEPLPAERFDPDEPFMDAKALLACLTPGAQAEVSASESFHPDWRFGHAVTSAADTLEIELPVPAPAVYRLTIGHVAESPGVMTATLNGKDLPLPMVTRAAGAPEKTVFPAVRLAGGKAKLVVRKAGRFGIYGLKLVPQLRPLDTTRWSTAGPFQGFWSPQLRFNDGESAAAVKKGMEKRYPPQEENAGGAFASPEWRWTQVDTVVGTHEEAGVNFAQRSGLTASDIGFAQTFITSPEERDALIYIGTDWWANAWLNGELLRPEGNREEQAATGAFFNKWKPRPVKARLKKGENRLLVKNHGGSANCWFVCYITDAGGLDIAPLPAPAKLSGP